MLHCSTFRLLIELACSFNSLHKFKSSRRCTDPYLFPACVIMFMVIFVFVCLYVLMGFRECSYSAWSVAPPRFCNRGEVRYGFIGGLEYEVPQSRLYCLYINWALCSTALQCICRVIRRSSMTMKAHTYYITFGRPPIGGKLPPPPLTAPLCLVVLWSCVLTMVLQSVFANVK